MKSRLEKLRNEVMPECREDVSYISSKDILNKVDEKLNAVPSERRIYMKQKVLKGFAIACIVTAAMASSVFAMTNIDLLKQFFSGDTTSMEKYVKTLGESVSDGNIRISIDKVITTKYSIKTVVAAEALTPEGEKILNSEDFELIRDTYINYVNDYDGHYIEGWGGQELFEYNTDKMRVWEFSIDAMGTEKDGEEVALQFECIDTDDNVIVIELNTDVETIEYTLPGQPYGNAVLKLNPMGVIIEKEVPADEELEIYDMNTFFIMDDGSVKTYNQLFDVDMMSLRKEGKEYDRWECTADAREILDLSKFKKVIVDGIEYDLDNVNNYKKADESSLLKPFETETKDFYVPFDDFLKGIGAEMTENGFKYNGNTYEITNSGGIIKNGDIENSFDKRIVTMDGKEYIATAGMNSLFGVQNYVKNSEAPLEERIMVLVP